jgi:hypothetical protein
MFTADQKERRRADQAGGIMLLVLVLLIVSIAIMSAMLRYVSRQSHETVDQEQEEQAFNAADSGVSYVLWLLDPDGGGEVPTSVSTMSRVVYDDLGEPIGTFTIDDIVADTGVITFTSTGRHIALTNRCQAIVVELKQREAGAQYIATNWDHQVGYPCS